jgi:hypothetical protein
MPMVLAYFATKLAAYTAWCLLALHRLHGRRSSVDLARAAGYGVARVLIGLALGFALVTAMPTIAPAPNRMGFSIPVYTLALTLLRVFEWLAVGGMILARDVAPMPGLVSRTAWVVGGVGVSFLTDVLVLALGIGLDGVPC